ncbi:hypothetical protein B5M47_03950 [candidate division CPR3 bacterium 4484_211]|uniref:histidine kinase n=1 Tax=candidate division CPR3 bacterium 4484_211 TaxID=1968527 RepID=A0A1W9NXS2_UNCC3|nr:MAG: hypothetical protein B5M47_03950 [candidate division CPR3 bacterium 4484_211]
MTETSIPAEKIRILIPKLEIAATVIIFTLIFIADLVTPLKFRVRVFLWSSAFAFLLVSYLLNHLFIDKFKGRRVRWVLTANIILYNLFTLVVGVLLWGFTLSPLFFSLYLVILIPGIIFPGKLAYLIAAGQTLIIYATLFLFIDQKLLSEHYRIVIETILDPRQAFPSYYSWINITSQVLTLWGCAFLSQYISRELNMKEEIIHKLKELDKQKSELIGMIAHNLRTPVANIKGCVEVLEKDKENLTQEEQKKYFSALKEQAAKLNQLIEKMVKINNLQSGKIHLMKTKFPLVSVINHCTEQIKPLLDNKKLGLSVQIPSNISEIFADREKIREVILALLDNAIKFSRPNSKITITAEIRENSVVASVANYGVGIPPEKKSDIFKPLFRGTDLLTYNFEGTGVGLFVSQKIIKAHQGKMWFKSVPNEQTVFYFSLPLKPA